MSSDIDMFVTILFSSYGLINSDSNNQTTVAVLDVSEGVDGSRNQEFHFKGQFGRL